MHSPPAGQHFTGSIPTNDVEMIAKTEDFTTTFNITIIAANSLSLASPLNFTIEGDLMSITSGDFESHNIYAANSAVLPCTIMRQGELL